MIKEKEKIVEQKENPEVKETEKHSKKNGNKKIIIVCSVIAITIIIAIFSTIFALINSNNEKILNGISINGISVSGKDKDEVKKLLAEKTEAKRTEDLVVKLNTKTKDGEEYKGIVSFEQLQLNYKLDEAIEKEMCIRDSIYYIFMIKSNNGK